MSEVVRHRVTRGIGQPAAGAAADKIGTKHTTAAGQGAAQFLEVPGRPRKTRDAEQGRRFGRSRPIGHRQLELLSAAIHRHAMEQGGRGAGVSDGH